MHMYLYVSAFVCGHICVYVQVYLCVYMYSYMYSYMHMDIYAYMDICVHVFAYFILKNDLLIVSSFYFNFFQDTECKLLVMFKGEVSISDSLLLPPFSNKVVK